MWLLPYQLPPRSETGFSVNQQILMKLAVFFLPLQIRSSSSPPCPVTCGADRGGMHLGLTSLQFLVGFGEWAALAMGTEGGRKVR